MTDDRDRLAVSSAHFQSRMANVVPDGEPRPRLGLDGPEGPAHILIVDDEPHDRQLLQLMLSDEGFVLLTAPSGEEALALLARERVDLVLLDVRMRGMDGSEVTANIKCNHATQHIPVIMV